MKLASYYERRGRGTMKVIIEKSEVWSELIASLKSLNSKEALSKSFSPERRLSFFILCNFLFLNLFLASSLSA